MKRALRIPPWGYQRQQSGYVVRHIRLHVRRRRVLEDGGMLAMGLPCNAWLVYLDAMETHCLVVRLDNNYL